MTRSLDNNTAPTPTPWLVVAAFAAIYLVWGSTYLAIRVAIETMPPLIMLGARFGVAGLLMVLWARGRGAAPATPRQWGWAALLGLLMPAWGTGSVAWAEQYVASGLTAVLVATVPLVIVAIDAMQGRRGLNVRVVFGVLAGFGGVAFLMRPGAVGGDPSAPVAIWVLVLGTLAWSAGAVVSRSADHPGSQILATGLQMAIGGVVLVVAGLALGEGPRVELASFSMRSFVAFVYLIVFGSFIAFSAYTWLLRVTEPAKVATYAYVNPVIALFLGWSLAGETLDPQVLAAAAVILASVVLILKTPQRRRPAPEAVDTRPAAAAAVLGATITPCSSGSASTAS
ncbi:MAG TPA: EamA family transporter [Thermoanaerobaculia bacterium]